MKITATSESNAQELARWTTYSGDYWSAVRIVAWIAQDATANRTTLTYKWQKGANLYYCYWLDSKTFTVSIGAERSTLNFALGRTADGWQDLSSGNSITVAHDSNGEFSGTLGLSGYKYWEAFDSSVSIEFPAITAETGEEETPPVRPESDDSPYYSIWADGELVYFHNLEGYEVFSPKLTLEVNRAGSLTFEIPTTNAMYSKLAKLKTTIECRQGDEVLFRGRVLNEERGFRNTKKIYCEGMLSWLVDTVQNPYTFMGTAKDLLKQFLNTHNEQASDNRKIEYTYSDIGTKVAVVQDSFNYVFSEIQRTLLNSLGGYLIPYYTAEKNGLQYVASYSGTNSQVVRFGVNLLDFSEYIDAANVFTGVVPIGADGLTLPETYIFDDDAVELFGKIIRTVKFDNVATIAGLRQAGQMALKSGIETATTLSVKAVDLHLLYVDTQRIRLGDSIRVVSVPHNIDAFFRCNKMTLDLQNPARSEYNFGSLQGSLTGKITEENTNTFIVTED